MFFHVFSVSISGLVFNRIFNGKWLEKASPKSIPGATFSAKKAPKAEYPFPGFPSWSRPFFGHRFFYVFWSLSAPFWSMLGPFGSILAPFGIILVTQRPTCNVQRSILDAPGSILYEINRISNRSPQVRFFTHASSQCGHSHTLQSTKPKKKNNTNLQNP